MLLKFPVEIQQQIIEHLDTLDIAPLLEAYQSNELDRLFLLIYDNPEPVYFSHKILNTYRITSTSLDDYKQTEHTQLFNLIEIQNLKKLDLLEFCATFSATTNFICFPKLWLLNSNAAYNKLKHSHSFEVLKKRSKFLIGAGNGELRLSTVRGIFTKISVMNMDNNLNLRLSRDNKLNTSLRIALPLEIMSLEAVSTELIDGMDLSKYPSKSLCLSGSNWSITNKAIAASESVEFIDVYHMGELTLSCETLEISVYQNYATRPFTMRAVRAEHLRNLILRYDSQSELQIDGFQTDALKSLIVKPFNPDLMIFNKFRNLEELEFSVVEEHASGRTLTKKDYTGTLPKLKRLKIENGFKDICMIPQISAPLLEEFEYDHSEGPLTDSELLSTLKMYPMLHSFRLCLHDVVLTMIEKSLRYSANILKFLEVISTDCVDMELFGAGTVDFPGLEELYLILYHDLSSAKCELRFFGPKVRLFSLRLPKNAAQVDISGEFPKLEYIQISHTGGPKALEELNIVGNAASLQKVVLVDYDDIAGTEPALRINVMGEAPVWDRKVCDCEPYDDPWTPDYGIRSDDSESD